MDRVPLRSCVASGLGMSRITWTSAMKNRPTKKASAQGTTKVMKASSDTLPYDLQAERKNCLVEELRCRDAVAWFAGGKLAFELGATTQRGRKQARCLVVSMGDRWEIWKAADVRHHLLNQRSTRGETNTNEAVDIVPIERSVFDGDDDPLAFFSQGCRPEDCLRLITRTLGIVRARLDSVKGQAPLVLGQLKGRSYAVMKEEVTQRLEHLDQVLTIWEMGTKAEHVVDAALALKQGFLMGERLAQVEALLANAAQMRLAARQGSSGMHRSRFWTWVVTSPEFQKIGQKEAFYCLDGRPDPDHPGTKLELKDDTIIRGDGKPLTLASFKAQYSGHRAHEKRKVKG